MANATSRLFVLGLLAALPVTAGDSRRGSGEKPIPDVVVYVADSNVVPTSVLLQAEATATRMFAEIGVNVQWTERRPSRGGETAGGTCAAKRPTKIGVRMAMKKTASAGREAFASAYPYANDDVRITLFSGELHEAMRPQRRLEPIVMAHILVHELTHVLQGVARHSEAGVMQAHWTPRDYAGMERNPLKFTGEDTDLVHLGMAKNQFASCVGGLPQRASRTDTVSLPGEF